MPAQALALMNDPFLIDQAKFWAGRLVEDSNSTTEKRIEIMYLTALGRPPTAQEFARMQTLVEQFMDLHQVEPDRLPGSELVWKEACHAIFNVKELIYVW